MSVALRVLWRQFHVEGSDRFLAQKRSRDPGVFWVNAAIEVPGGDFRLEVKDYRTPTEEVMTEAARESFRAMLNDQQVHVSCMGGIGRTGTVLACLAKVAGVPNPVKWVRKHYDRKACETPQQVEFVSRFPVARLRIDVLAMLTKKTLFPYWKV